MASGSSSSQTSSTAEESFVVSHHQLGFNLGHRIHGHADQNQQRRAAKVKLITHTGRNPGQAGRTADERVQPGANQRQARHLESAQHELRNERDQRQINRADDGQPRQDAVQIFRGGSARPNARHESAVLAQIVSHFFNVENDRDVKEREEDNQRKKDQFVIGIAGMKRLEESPDLAPRRVRIGWIRRKRCKKTLRHRQH